LAYPDRIAQRRAGSDPKYRLSNGRGAVLPQSDPLAAQDWITVADLDGAAREARIFLAAPVTQGEIEAEFAADIARVDTVYWDARAAAVVARRQRRLGELVLDERPLDGAMAEERVIAAMIEGIREMGLAVLPWTKELDAWRQRVLFLRKLDGDASDWPDVSDAGLTATLETWLAPYLTGISRRDHLRRLDLGEVLKAMLPWDKRKTLDTEAPTHVTVPSGSRLAIDYGADGGPALEVKLQEMFGAQATPAIARGRVPLVLRLLSPARRPIQVTRDLAGFWRTSYIEVRKQMRGKYPKHNWPEDPLAAAPTARTIKRPSREPS
jgi:ATP-dependent helicase HrpB